MATDFRRRFLFKNGITRGAYVQIQRGLKDIPSYQNAPSLLKRYLAEVLAASILLSSTIKFNGSLLLQIRGQGKLKYLVAEATSEASYRGSISWNEEENFTSNLSLKDVLGAEAICTVSVRNKEGKDWQGVVPLGNDSIGEILQHYMVQSEGVLTTFEFAWQEDVGIKAMLLQRLPQEGRATTNHVNSELKEAQEEETWHTIKTLEETLTTEELSTLTLPEIIRRLFHEYEVVLYPVEPFEYKCQCNWEKTADTLRLLGEKESEKMARERGQVDLTCGYCGKVYRYSNQELNQVFQDKT